MGKIILHVEGKNLPKMDLLSKSDPYLCVFIGKKKNISLLQINQHFVIYKVNKDWFTYEIVHLVLGLFIFHFKILY